MIIESRYNNKDSASIQIPFEKRSDWEPSPLRLTLLQDPELTNAIVFPQFNIGFKSSELTFGNKELASLATYIYKQHYNKNYWYAVDRTVNSSAIAQIEFYCESTTLFVLSDDRISASQETTRETVESLPIELWDGITQAEDIAVNSLEKVTGHTVSEDTIRVPVNDSLSESQSEIVVHIVRLLSHLYRDNYVLKELGQIKELMYDAFGRAGYTTDSPLEQLSYPEDEITEITPPDFIENNI